MPPPHPFTAVVKLPRDDQAEQVSEPTAHGALHWAPYHDKGFQARMHAVARWVADARPEAFVTDVSVEVAVFVRLLGVPVVVMALPGKRIDPAHLLAHRLADHIIAAWPQELCVPTWLRPFANKTSYVGGISRFDGRTSLVSCHDAATTGVRVLVLGGASDGFGLDMSACAQQCPGTTWTMLGGSGGRWTADPWPHIGTADVVVTHAGQSSIADVAAAQRRAVVIPLPRPFDEQRATAAVLRKYRIATVVQDWPDVRAWPGLLADALAREPTRWARWQVQGAARRAASAIEATSRRCAMVGAP
ncbi:MAG: hypothetical protein JO236_20590 [Mycobacterium sp.]|uniref:glycosyltransferase n=1 Tax=Mycobacterium sp. TaxID=1785 RepID=UPI001ED65C26|nr:glycosyltransferase [Mycobacterium sp.]MBW0019923.1 hypothetical protein [Mycobacterium sp.]